MSLQPIELYSVSNSWRQLAQVAIEELRLATERVEFLEAKIARGPKMTVFSCTDGVCAVDISAETAQLAAFDYVDGGDWTGHKAATLSIVVSSGDEVVGEFDINLTPSKPYDFDEDGIATVWHLEREK